MTQGQHVAPLRRAPAPKCERIFHLACWRCPRAITNELIIAPSQHARTFTRADKHVEWLPRLTRRSSGQLVAFVAVINHPLQMTSRAAPHHSEGSLSAARSGRSSFLDGMDCKHVKIARLELWEGVSSALGSRTSACGQRLRVSCPGLMGAGPADNAQSPEPGDRRSRVGMNAFSHIAAM